MTPDADESRHANLGVKATRGVFWIGGGQVIRQVIGISTAVILARLLSPQDFGLFAMVFVFIELAHLFADFGIGSAIIQSKETSREVLSSAFWANAAVGVVLVLITAAASPAIANFYGDDRLILIALALSLTLFLAGTMVVPQAILYKDMRFKYVIWAQIVGSLSGATVAITLALNDYGVWCLVWQPIVGSSVAMVLTFVFSGWRPTMRFSLRGIRHLITFSLDVLGTDILDYASHNSDKLLVGKFLGNSALGHYNLAFQLMLYPLTHVASVIARVLFPTLSLLQDERPRVQAACLKAAAALGLVTFPMMVGLFLVSEDFILVVFGEKWLPMKPVLQILCAVGMIQSLGTVSDSIYLSTGRTRTMVRIAMVSAPITVVAIVIGLPWGIVGVAFAYALTTIAALYVNLWVSLKFISVRLRDYHAVLVRPLAASAIMAGAVWFARWAYDDVFAAGSVQRLALCVGIGIVAYAVAALFLNRILLHELWRLVSASFARERSVHEGT